MSNSNSNNNNNNNNMNRYNNKNQKAEKLILDNYFQVPRYFNFNLIRN